MQLTIEKMIYGGDGLARLPGDEHGRGKAVFVPFVLSGERVEVELIEQKAGFARAQAKKILEASAHRVEPRCPYFQRCGGCHYQHADYEHQLAIKAEILKENLRRIAKVELSSELEIHPSPPWNYRNRTRLRVRTNPFALGYFRFNSHELLPVEECPISSPLINRAISVMWKLGRAGMRPVGVGEIEFFVDAGDNNLLVELSCSEESGTQGITTKDTKVHEGEWINGWVAALRSELPALVGVVVATDGRAALGEGGSETRPQTVTQGRVKTYSRAVIVGRGELTYRTQYAIYRVSAGSFFQVNRYLTDELVSIVTSGRSGRTALDLYAGVGLFSAILARQFDHIVAVESSQSSFADLRYNLPANVKALRATVEAYVAKTSKQQPDLVVVDPPRNGLGERVARNLAGLNAPRITYVSCDPATLARDLKVLLAAGYQIGQAHVIDLFPQTYHVESVLQLVR